MSESRRTFETGQKGTGDVRESAPGGAADREAVPDASPSVRLFSEQIRKEAQEEIEKIREKAELSARRKTQEAEREAERIAREMGQGAEEQAKSIDVRTMAGVSLETKRTMLRLQGQITDEVLAKAMARFKELRGTKQYADFLKELAVQGILALGEETCVLAPAAEDRDLFTEELVRGIEDLARRRSGRKVMATVSMDVSPDGSGIRVYSGKGNMLFDNTLEARLERLWDELIMTVMKEVFAGEREQKCAPDDGSHAGE